MCNLPGVIVVIYQCKKPGYGIFSSSSILGKSEVTKWCQRRKLWRELSAHALEISSWERPSQTSAYRYVEIYVLAFGDVQSLNNESFKAWHTNNRLPSRLWSGQRRRRFPVPWPAPWPAIHRGRPERVRQWPPPRPIRHRARPIRQTRVGTADRYRVALAAGHLRGEVSQAPDRMASRGGGGTRWGGVGGGRARR